jgi:hypothetical protein
LAVGAAGSPAKKGTAQVIDSGLVAFEMLALLLQQRIALTRIHMLIMQHFLFRNIWNLPVTVTVNN